MIGDKTTLRKAPDFIGVGTMKSGTTTLIHHLNQHDKIHTAPKELHFFNNDKKFKKGLGWYESQIAKQANSEQIIYGEKTPTYSYQENVAKRIYEAYPKVKLLWIFRNPVDRTYSNYLHAFKNGSEILAFPEALEKEDERIKKNIWLGYKKRSLYHEQVSRFLEYFPKEQMFFVLFEQLIQPYNDDHILNKLFEFLGLTEDDFQFVLEPRNKTVLPRFPKVLYSARSLGLLNYRLTRKAINFLNFYGKSPGYEKMNIELRQELVEYFKPHNETLSKQIDTNLSFWDK